MEVDGKMMACIAGCTFPWGDELTERKDDEGDGREEEEQML